MAEEDIYFIFLLIRAISVLAHLVPACVTIFFVSGIDFVNISWPLWVLFLITPFLTLGAGIMGLLNVKEGVHILRSIIGYFIVTLLDVFGLVALVAIGTICVDNSLIVFNNPNQSPYPNVEKGHFYEVTRSLKSHEEKVRTIASHTTGMAITVTVIGVITGEVINRF